jgi:hypothetical protein
MNSLRARTKRETNGTRHEKAETPLLYNSTSLRKRHQVAQEEEGHEGWGRGEKDKAVKKETQNMNSLRARTMRETNGTRHEKAETQLLQHHVTAETALLAQEEEGYEGWGRG